MTNVGIVMVNWNGFKDTVACIDSIFETQQALTYHIYLVDNGSDDGSEELLRERYRDRKSISLLFEDENRGFSTGFNAGLRKALSHGCTSICIANNDLIFTKTTLVPLLKHASADPNCGFCTGIITYEDQRDRIWAAGGDFSVFSCTATGRHFNAHFDDCDTGVYEVDYIPGALVFGLAATWKEIGTELLPECYFLGGEEVDVCLRLKRKGFRSVFVSESVTHHKVGYSGVVSLPYIYNRFRNRLMLSRRNFNWLVRIPFLIHFVVKFIVAAGLLSIFSSRYRDLYRCALHALVDHSKSYSILRDDVVNYPR